MELSDVTLGQFLRLVGENVEGVHMEAIDVPGNPDKPPLFVIDVDRRAGGDHRSRIAPTSQPTPPPAAQVRVVSLTDLVGPRAMVKPGSGDHIREATDDVLSAVQAALDVAALPGPPTTLKVHQPTLTLVVRGTEAQLDLIDQTLQTLHPREDNMGQRLEDAVAEVNRLRSQISDMEEKAKATTQN